MNVIGFVEIPSKDLQATCKFYSELFGWICQPLAGTRYAFFHTGFGVKGGFSLDDEPSSGGVVVYVETDDIEGTLTRAGELGARTVVGKTHISFEQGYYGRFMDPHGNVIGLWSPA